MGDRARAHPGRAAQASRRPARAGGGGRRGGRAGIFALASPPPLRAMLPERGLRCIPWQSLVFSCDIFALLLWCVEYPDMSRLAPTVWTWMWQRDIICSIVRSQEEMFLRSVCLTIMLHFSQPSWSQNREI